MTQVSAIDINRSATYNAVKIQVNNPQTNISDGFKLSPEDNGTYNAVAIEINNPKVQAGKKHNHGIYNYPCADCMVTSDLAPIHAVSLPKLPVYQTTNFINNRTLINAELGQKNSSKEIEETIKENKTMPEVESIVIEKTVTVPLPNVTTVEEQKAEAPAFKGDRRPIEIVPSVEIKPTVDIPKIVKNLSSDNYDKQAQQMEDIAKISMEDPQKAVPYIVTEVFSELIDIVKKDTSNLAIPTERQIEIRKQIIINELVKEKALMEKKDLNSIELPFNISEAARKEAAVLSPMEQAERNKEYGLYTIAILSKVYTDEIQKHTGNVVPLTELPGVSEIVDTLRYDSNPSIKVSAIDALVYLNKPEYNAEIKSILSIASKEKDAYVAQNALRALETI